MKACTLFTSDNEVAEDWLGKFDSREPLDIYGQKYLIDEISTDYEPGFSGATIKMYPVYQAKSPELPKKQDAWDGVGIPPVGAECEVIEGPAIWENSGMTAWVGQNVKVKSNFTNNIGQQIASVERDNSECACFIVKCLRPIKTAEQLAEEEKKKVIDDMQRIYEESMLDYSSRLGHASRPAIKALYESGYRKQ